MRKALSDSHKACLKVRDVPRHLIPILAAGCLVSAMSMRVVEPVVPEIARDLNVSADLIALTTTAFAVPYAAGQLLLGPLGDAIGKARVIKVALGLLAVCLALSSVAQTAGELFAARILAGLAGGGVIPLAFAMLGDRFSMADRQIALSRILTAIIIGQVLGATGSGLLASAIGWREVMLTAAALTFAALLIMAVTLKSRPDAERHKLSIAGMKASYGIVFANPRAAICFTAVFVEGIAIFGLLPYLAILLEERGAGGVREAGFVLSGIAIGGLTYAALVPVLLRRLGLYNLIRSGGIVMGLGMGGVTMAVSWPMEMLAFTVIGLGFYMVHNSLQTQATELAPGNRGAAVALHAFFFFFGQAVGPVVYAAGLRDLGAGTTIGLAAVTLALLGFATAAGLEKREVTSI